MWRCQALVKCNIFWSNLSPGLARYNKMIVLKNIRWTILTILQLNKLTPVNVKHRRLVNFTLPRLFTVYPPAGLQFTSIEGGGAEPPWAPQTYLRSLLIRRMTSKPHKTIFWPIPTSPSLCHSVSVPQILISANCINFYLPFTREWTY